MYILYTDYRYSTRYTQPSGNQRSEDAAPAGGPETASGTKQNSKTTKATQPHSHRECHRSREHPAVMPSYETRRDTQKKNRGGRR